MKYGLNSGEKIGIRTLGLFVRENSHCFQDLSVVNTGSNKYTIILEYFPNSGIQYKVNKNSKSGKFLGTVEINKVSEHGLEYNRAITKIVLPDSVVKYIVNHYKYTTEYLRIGEEALHR